MDWWNRLGGFAAMFPDTPALAVDFALHGPADDRIAFDLGYGIQATPTEFNVYPNPAGEFSSVAPQPDLTPAFQDEEGADLGIG